MPKIFKSQKPRGLKTLKTNSLNVLKNPMNPKNCMYYLLSKIPLLARL